MVIQRNLTKAMATESPAICLAVVLGEGTRCHTIRTSRNDES